MLLILSRVDNGQFFNLFLVGSVTNVVYIYIYIYNSYRSLIKLTTIIMIMVGDDNGTKPA